MRYHTLRIHTIQHITYTYNTTHYIHIQYKTLRMQNQFYRMCIHIQYNTLLGFSLLSMVVKIQLLFRLRSFFYDDKGIHFIYITLGLIVANILLKTGIKNFQNVKYLNHITILCMRNNYLIFYSQNTVSIKGRF